MGEPLAILSKGGYSKDGETLSQSIEQSRRLAAAADTDAGRRAIGRWQAVIQVDGDRAEVCHIIVAAQALQVRQGPHIHPTAVVRGSDESLAMALSGSIDFTHLLSEGQATVTGNYYDIINLGRVAAAVGRSKVK